MLYGYFDIVYRGLSTRYYYDAHKEWVNYKDSFLYIYPYLIDKSYVKTIEVNSGIERAIKIGTSYSSTHFLYKMLKDTPYINGIFENAEINVDSEPNRYMAVKLIPHFSGTNTEGNKNKTINITMFVYINIDNFNVCYTGNIGKQNIVLFNLKSLFKSFNLEPPDDDYMRAFFSNIPLKGFNLYVVILKLIGYLKISKGFKGSLYNLFTRGQYVSDLTYRNKLIDYAIMVSYYRATHHFQILFDSFHKDCVKSRNLLSFLAYNYYELPMVYVDSDSTNTSDLFFDDSCIHLLIKGFELMDRKQEIIKVIYSNKPRVNLARIIPENCEYYKNYRKIILHSKRVYHQFTLSYFSESFEKYKQSFYLNSTIKPFQYIH